MLIHRKLFFYVLRSFRGEINPPCETVNREGSQKLTKHHMKLKPHHTRKKLQFWYILCQLYKESIYSSSSIQMENKFHIPLCIPRIYHAAEHHVNIHIICKWTNSSQDWGEKVPSREPFLPLNATTDSGYVTPHINLSRQW